MPDVYVRKLIAEKIMTEAAVKEILDAHTRYLAAEYAAVDTTFKPEAAYFERQWSDLGLASSEVTTWDTGLDWDILQHVAEHSIRVPDDFVSVSIQFVYACIYSRVIFSPCVRPSIRI